MLKPRYVFAYKKGTAYKDNLTGRILSDEETSKVDLIDLELDSVEYLDENNNSVRVKSGSNLV